MVLAVTSWHLLRNDSTRRNAYVGARYSRQAPCIHTHGDTGGTHTHVIHTHAYRVIASDTHTTRSIGRVRVESRNVIPYASQRVISHIDHRFKCNILYHLSSTFLNLTLFHTPTDVYFFDITPLYSCLIILHTSSDNMPYCDYLSNMLCNPLYTTI